MISIVELIENSVSRSNIMSMVSGHHPYKTASYDERKPKAEQQKQQDVVQQQQTSPEIQQTEISTMSGV